MAIRSAQNHPRVVTDRQSGVPAWLQWPCSLPSAVPTPMETVCHGPPPLAGRLSCQSLRRNAVRGLVTSSAHAEGHPVDDGEALGSLRILQSHNHSACCGQLSVTRGLSHAGSASAVGSVATLQPAGVGQFQATQVSNNTIGASLTMDAHDAR